MKLCHDICFFQAFYWYFYEQPINDRCPTDFELPKSYSESLQQLPKAYQQYSFMVRRLLVEKRRIVWSWQDEICFYYFLQYMLLKEYKIY